MKINGRTSLILLLQSKVPQVDIDISLSIYLLFSSSFLFLFTLQIRVPKSYLPKLDDLTVWFFTLVLFYLILLTPKLTLFRPYKQDWHPAKLLNCDSLAAQLLVFCCKANEKADVVVRAWTWHGDTQIGEL